jgi:hypothetical protein
LIFIPGLLSYVHSVADEKQLGAHGGGIPPGWDFPEARAAAEQGEDLWLLDAAQRLTPWERMKAAISAARLAAMLREAGRKHYGV